MKTNFEELQSKSKLGIPILLEVKGKDKLVGTVHEKVFYKTISKFRHFLRIPPAICIDVGIFENYIREGCNNIIVLETDNKDVYRTPTYLFAKNSTIIDKGYGRQYALPMMWWIKNDNGVR